MDDQNISTEQNLERRLNELESIVALLEDGSISINEAIAKYSEGMKLALDCRRDLNLLSRKVAEARDEAMEAFSRLAKEQKQEQEEWLARSQQRQVQASAPTPNHAPYNPNGPVFGQANMPHVGAPNNQGPMGMQGSAMGSVVPPQMGSSFGPQGQMTQGPINQGAMPHPVPMGPSVSPMMQGPVSGMGNQALVNPASGATSQAPNQSEQGNANGHAPVPPDSEVPF